MFYFGCLISTNINNVADYSDMVSYYFLSFLQHCLMDKYGGDACCSRINRIGLDDGEEEETVRLLCT